MRARNEARRERFLNARQRSIGIDVQELDKQVGEKASRKADQDNEDMEYSQRMTYISQLVEQREAPHAGEREVLPDLCAARARREAYGRGAKARVTGATRVVVARKRARARASAPTGPQPSSSTEERESLRCASRPST